MSNSKVLLPEEVVMGCLYRAVLDLTPEQEQARTEVIAALGERPKNRDAAAQWSEAYHGLCAEAGVPTQKNGLPFHIRLVPVEKPKPQVAGDNDRTVTVSCKYRSCGNKQTLPVSEAIGWACEEHSTQSTRLSVKTTKRQQHA